MNEIRDYIMSIIFTLVIFMIGSVCWYRLHLNYQMINNTLNNLQEVYIDEDVVLSNIKRVSDKSASKLDSYRFVLTNDSNETRRVCIKLVDDYYGIYNSENKINNNYLRYMIKKDNGAYSDIRSLNMDGEIYIDDISARGEFVYEIKLWVSDNYQDDFTYHGNLVITYL